MIKVFILDSNIEEISHKGYNQITNEEFKLFGKEYSLEQFQEDLNRFYGTGIYNRNHDHVKFIEVPEEITSLHTLIGYFAKGFTINFVENPAVGEGKGFLHLNPQNMPKP